MYRIVWQRNWLFSLMGCFRDGIVNLIPVNKLPLFIIRLLYGIRPKFVFLVHARRSQDIFVGYPFLAPFRRYISKPTLLSIARKLPPIVVGKVITPQKVNGLTIFSPFVPEKFLEDRRTSLKEARRIISLACRISDVSSFIGLGAWWPIVTRRGLAVKDYTEKRKSFITNGHCATTISIYLTVKKICNLSKMPFDEVKIAIIGGGGKLGSCVTSVFHGKVKTISIIDINRMKLSKLEMEFNKKKAFTTVNTFLNDDKLCLRDVLGNHHIGICATSNLKRVITLDDLPDNFIIIDDSRPEAISRRGKARNKVVLEGGLFKIKDSIIDHDYGFGMDENVFGCLAEAYILSLDKGCKLKPTVGNLDIENITKMMEFCEEHGLTAGDFKSQDLIIPEAYLIKIMADRDEVLKRSGSKKNG